MNTAQQIDPRRLNRVIASPRARRLMREMGVAPASLKGSGPGGRIVIKDVKEGKALPAPQGARGGISIMRRAIAEKTALSFSTVPHFYLRVEADVTDLMRFKEDCTPEVLSKAGVKPTVSDFILRAMARALADFPFANSVWRQDTIVKLGSVDVGLVIGVEDGLLIPVIRGADRLSLAELAKARAGAVEAARSGKLTAADTQGAAMSLSNLGTSAVDEFAAVISPGQSSMLAIGRAAPRPFVVNNQLVVRTTLRLCLSVDHRVMDGAPAAEMLGRLVYFLEHPRD